MRGALRQRDGQGRSSAHRQDRSVVRVQQLRRAPRRLLGRRRNMETTTMKTVTLEVASRDDVTRRALEAFRGKKQRARISFATPELLWKVLTAKRWELLKAMAGQGP